jgi:hypothetical protein
MISYFLDLMCKISWIASNLCQWKLNKFSKCKFKRLGNEFTLRPMDHTTLVLQKKWMEGKFREGKSKGIGASRDFGP